MPSMLQISLRRTKSAKGRKIYQQQCRSHFVVSAHVLASKVQMYSVIGLCQYQYYFVYCVVSFLSADNTAMLVKYFNN
jgi:hypothetical protein